MREEFHRIRRMPPYVFAEVNGAKARARAAGEDVIDLGMGNPDSGTPPHIVAKLVEAVQDPRTHRYSTSKGIPGLRRALAGYYERRFGVSIDPETEIVATMGSKEGLAAWAPIPERYASLGSVDFSKLLLSQAKVAVAPGIGFGEHGDGHVRIALVENTHRLRQAVRSIRDFLRLDSNVAQSEVAAG